MSHSYKVTFARYRKGEMRISNPHWLNVDSFQTASTIAHNMLWAMQGADPDSTFHIAYIDAQIRGIECNGGQMFETMDELGERVKANKKLAQ